MEYHFMTKNKEINYRERQLARQVIRNLHELQKSLLRIAKEHRKEDKLLNANMTTYQAGKLGGFIEELLKLYSLGHIDEVIKTPSFLSESTLENFPELTE